MRRKKKSLALSLECFVAGVFAASACEDRIDRIIYS